MMDTTVFWFDKKMRFGSLRGRNVDKAALKSGFSVARTSFHGKKLTAIFTLHSDVTVESLLNNAATFNRVCALVEFRGIWKLKFIYSEKAIKCCEISNVDLFYVITVKTMVEISQKFVTFSQYMNFTSTPLWKPT